MVDRNSHRFPAQGNRQHLTAAEAEKVKEDFLLSPPRHIPWTAPLGRPVTVILSIKLHALLHAFEPSNITSSHGPYPHQVVVRALARYIITNRSRFFLTPSDHITCTIRGDPLEQIFHTPVIKLSDLAKYLRGHLKIAEILPQPPNLEVESIAANDATTGRSWAVQLQANFPQPHIGSPPSFYTRPPGPSNSPPFLHRLIQPQGLTCSPAVGLRPTFHQRPPAVGTGLPATLAPQARPPLPPTAFPRPITAPTVPAPRPATAMGPVGLGPIRPISSRSHDPQFWLQRGFVLEPFNPTSAPGQPRLPNPPDLWNLDLRQPPASQGQPGAPHRALTHDEASAPRPPGPPPGHGRPSVAPPPPPAQGQRGQGDQDQVRWIPMPPQDPRPNSHAGRTPVRWIPMPPQAPRPPNQGQGRGNSVRWIPMPPRDFQPQGQGNLNSVRWIPMPPRDPKPEE